MTIYEDIIRGTTDQGLIVVDGIMERMSASIGGHILNLANLDKRFFLKNRSPMNFRTHVVYIAPSGWTKSTYFRLMLRQKYGMLWNRDQIFPIDVHTSFSIASWLGTIHSDKENGPQATEGVFQRYKRGIVGADDYQALKLLFDGEGIQEDERALMTALDTDEAIKNLSLGQIRIPNVGITCWFGMRPTTMNLTSGLARRFTFGRFFPNRQEARLFRQIARNQMVASLGLEDLGDEPDPEETPMFQSLSDAYDSICQAGHTDLNMEPVDSYLDQFEMPHFEENIYRNLAIGWSVANGHYPDIRLGVDGKHLIEDEVLSREILRTDPYRMMFYRILQAEPDHTISLSSLNYFLKTFLQFSESEVQRLLRIEKLEKRMVWDTVEGKKVVRLDWEPDYLAQLKDTAKGQEQERLEWVRGR